MKNRIVALSLLLATSFAFGAGSISVSRGTRSYAKAGTTGKYVEIVTVSFVGDASDGSVPTLAIPMSGFVKKVVTNPGSTAPTANYDIALGDPEDSALDALGAALQNRHTSNTEQVYPLLAGAPGTVSSTPVFLAGTYTLAITNNSVNSATGTITFYLVDQQ